MTESAIKAWEHWRDASDKQDYYVLGMSVALTAYLGEHLVVGVVGFNAPTIQLASILFFATSVISGLLRIRKGVNVLAGSAVIIEQEGRVEALRSSLHDGVGPSDIGRLETTLASLRADRDGHARTGKRAFIWRDVCLAVGIAVFATAKVWAAVVAS